VVLVILAVPALSLLFMQNRQVQTKLSQYLAERLAEELKAEVSLSSVTYYFFRRVQVRDLYLEDINGDTLLYAALAKARIGQFRPDPRGLTFRKVTVEDALVNLVIDSLGVVNAKYFTDMLRKPHVPPELKSRVFIASIDLRNTRFSLTKKGQDPGPAPIDFNHFHLYRINATVDDLEVYKDTVSMNVKQLECLERNGYDFGRINTLLSISKHHMHFNELEVKTMTSDLDVPRLWFDFERFNRFKHFSKDVDLQVESRESVVKMDDLAMFIPWNPGVLDNIILGGTVNGRLSDLDGDDLFVRFDDESTLAFDFHMIGLPDFQSTYLDFNFRKLNTSVHSLTGLLETAEKGNTTDPEPWTNLGKLDFMGRFTGYPDQFVASGLLATDMGRVLMDLSFNPDSAGGVGFEGSLRTENFRLGSFLEQENVDNLDMDVQARGNLMKGRISASLEGKIDTFEFYDYAYSNITLDGSLTNNTFEGGFSVADPNIKLDFQGRTDFSGEVPVHRFTADVARARPYYLNLPQSDPGYFISFLVETDLSGSSLDDLNGDIVLVNSLFEKSGSQLQLYDVRLTTRNTPEASLIRIRSEQLDLDLAGYYRLTELPRSFRNMMDQYIDVVPESSPFTDSSTYFNYSLTFKSTDPLLDFFYPRLRIENGSTLAGNYDPLNSSMDMEGNISRLELHDLVWHNLTPYAHSGESLLEAGFHSDSLTFSGQYTLENQKTALKVTADTADLGISWNNASDPAYNGDLHIEGMFISGSEKERLFEASLDPGIIVIKDQYWDIQPALVKYRKGYLQIDGFEVMSTNKQIMANGVISSETGHDFNLEVRNLDLAQLPSVAFSRMLLEGNLSGYLNYRHTDGIPMITSKLKVDSLKFNNQLLGSTSLEAFWDESGRSVRTDLRSVGPDGFRYLESSGTFVPGSDELDFDIQFNRLDLQVFEPYLEGIVHDMEGQASVGLTVDGTLKEPELNGNIEFSGTSATFDFLNTRYTFSDRARVYHNNIYFENFGVADQYGQLATVNGSVNTDYLKDLYVNLNIQAEDFRFMDTRQTQNESFYGTIVATGQINVRGNPDNLNVGIQARTGQNTALFLPLYQAREVKSRDFITFINTNAPEPEERPMQPGLMKGLSLEIEAEITEDAVVQLIFDPQVGDIIETSGRGNLRMELNPSSGFRIFGDVELNRGNYLFTLQNVINKRFQIEPGGNIRFSGSPMDANVDLEAIYTLRAAPYNLYPDVDEAQESLKRRIPVECHLLLEGELGEPTISTNISMPTADAETRNLLENATSTEEELMKQFLSLLVINNFYSVSGFGGEQFGTTGDFAGVTASELLSNQLSNWLSQISDDFDIGVSYMPGDEITSDEVELALSTQLLDDRIIISGNVDVGGQNPSQGNTPNIMGDFDVEFRVTNNVSVIAFNRARDELLFETAPYKQGVGLSFREDFDDFPELVNRYKEAIFNRKKKKNGDTDSSGEE